ncbi:hypothetical protein [Streptomyces sp. NPDC057623]|uniref:hypothetical protein n=1 Tax=Streptomyces sp. NPDC057623 TaxID=3346187 RepID=UPI0036B5D712
MTHTSEAPPSAVTRLPVRQRAVPRWAAGRAGARAEDDGYLLSLWWNRATDLSDY